MKSSIILVVVVVAVTLFFVSSAGFRSAEKGYIKATTDYNKAAKDLKDATNTYVELSNSIRYRIMHNKREVMRLERKNSLLRQELAKALNRCNKK